ncbi:diphthine synthase [Nanoarchaeota archaeon]
MTLYMIGIGLNDEKDVTVKGLEIIKRSAKVWLEGYTSILQCGVDRLEEFYGREVVVADRDRVEKKADDILADAESSDVAFLVVGDAMSATTHTDLVLRAFKKGISVEIVHNASVLTAVGVVGLELYKYGKTTSIVFSEKGWDVETHYDVVKENLARGLHTLCLLDIKVAEPSRDGLRQEDGASAEKPRFMTVAEGVKSLLAIEAKRKEGVFTDETLCVGCARLGSLNMKIFVGTAKELLDEGFGGPLHSLVVPGKLHFVEEEALQRWK